jgi:hypothetical protein
MKNDNENEMGQKIVSARLTPDQYEQLKERADEEQETISSYLIKAITSMGELEEAKAHYNDLIDSVESQPSFFPIKFEKEGLVFYNADELFSYIHWAANLTTNVKKHFAENDKKITKDIFEKATIRERKLIIQSIIDYAESVEWENEDEKDEFNEQLEEILDELLEE